MMVAASKLNRRQKVPLYPTGRSVKLKRCVLSFVLDRLGSYQTIEKEYSLLNKRNIWHSWIQRRLIVYLATRIC